MFYSAIYQDMDASDVESSHSCNSAGCKTETSNDVQHNIEIPDINNKCLLVGIDKKRDPRTVVKNYLCALRPWSFTISITPVALGSALALQDTGGFNFFIFVATVFTALSVHAAGNLVNTYYDFIRGIDNKKSDDRTLVDHHLSPQSVVWFGAFFYVCGCVGCMFLTFISSAQIEHIALVYFCGLSSSFLYTGGLSLKYIALGELLIVITFGPLTVLFSFLTQAGKLALFPLWYAIPLALNTGAILHANNARDVDSDQHAGIATLAIILGTTGSYFCFCALIFVPYVVFIFVALNYNRWMFLPVTSIFFAFKVEKQFRQNELAQIPYKVANLNFIFGFLYTLACVFYDHV